MHSRIAVLVSGGGTNLQALLDAVADGRLCAEICGVISDREDVYALERARKHGVEALYIPKAGLAARLKAELTRLRADMVVLAGFLSIVPPEVVAMYRERIVNIHPSLIPRHCGKGYYGIKVHQAVLAAGDTISGATTHIVDEGVDTGRIIMQEQVPVLPGDTAEILQQRVLAAEHRILVETVRRMTKEFEI